MASLQNFRSALNGFNRDDVVHYLEYANGKHEKQCAQLREQIRELQQELERTRTQTVPTSDASAQKVEELTRRCADLERENAGLRGQLSVNTVNDELDALRREAESRSRECETLHDTISRLTRERDQAREDRKALASRTEEELEAYRRAERTERLAQNRASQIYDQANGALADASSELDSAMQALRQVTEDTVSQIQILQEAVAGSKSAFAAAEAALHCIRPADGE